MRYAFLLSKEDIKLAKEEVLSLLDIKKFRLVNNLLFLDLDDIKLADRLAYTKKIYQFLFKSNKKNLIKEIKNFNWQSIYKGNFCVRVHKLGESTIKNLKEKELASYIWKRLKNPKVKLTNPKTSIEIPIKSYKFL